ncbi:MAG: AAA family ATPase [Dehalococcoidia bacterium]|nr:AAA family ATPase [Dehalococcoidia bacterium]
MKTNLKRLISALSHPQIYPEPTDSVILCQTPISCLFFTDEYVYKIKKPIDLGYLDYTSLEQRRYFCEQELILNRRLCPEIYLGVVAITFNGTTYAFSDSGKPIEYAVKMKRLPEERILYNMLEENTVNFDMMDTLARKVVEFHAHAPTNTQIASYGNIPFLLHNCEENFRQSRQYLGQVLTEEQFGLITDFSNSFIKEHSSLLKKRVAKHHIRNCHGDLHTQHICFSHDIFIFDCIEFNTRFRYCDTASEIAFLAMDLEHKGRADLSRRFLQQYIAQSGDTDATILFNFYKNYRACVRGKVACFSLDDPLMDSVEKERALETAQSYFDLAQSYSRKYPLLIIMVGLTGSGKTTLATALAGRTGAIHISSDITRKRLAGIPETEHHYDELDSGLYSAAFNRKTYDTIFAQATETIENGYSVILDAAFLKREERERAQALAKQKGATILFVECRLDADLTKKRLQQRLSQKTASDGCWEVYLKQLEWFEPLNHSQAHELVVDTSISLAQNIRQIMEQIG